MTKKSFTATMDKLIADVRGGWTAGVEVDQVYAHVQETHAEYHHPSGGQAFYLRDTVYLGQWLHHVSVGLIDHEGVHLQRQMTSVANGMERGVFARAPWEFLDLRKSGRPYVYHDGVEIYTRPPIVGRLSPEQLAQKSKMSRHIDPHRYRRR